MLVSILPYANSGDLVLPVDENQTLSLGQGYDSLSDTFSNAIVAIPSNPTFGAATTAPGGQVVRALIDVIDDNSEFRETLRISVSASARGFGGRGSAQYSLYRSVQLNSSDVYALFYVSVVNAAASIVDPRLSDIAREEWNNQRPENRKEAFVRAFGDSYVSSITTGGEFLAVFRMHARSRREREEIKASAKASFGAFKASGSYENLKDFFTSHTRTTTEFSRIGGAGPLPNNDVKSLLEAAQNFPDSVDPKNGGRPAQIFFTATPIGKVPDANTNIDLRARLALEKLEDIARVQEAVAIRLSDAKFALEAPEIFPDLSSAEATSMVSELDDAAIDLRRIADDVIEGRFHSLEKINIRKTEELPRPPQASAGAAVPLKLTVADLTGNDVKDKVVAENQWSGSNAMMAITVDCVLAEGANLEYRVRDTAGGISQWIGVRQTARSGKPINGVEMRITGPNAGKYSVRYGTKSARWSGSIYAEDGQLASTFLYHMREMKVSILTV